MMHVLSTPWFLIILLVACCVITLIKLVRIERSGRFCRRSQQRQQRLHCLVLMLCAAMLFLLPFADEPQRTTNATVDSRP